MPAIFSLALSSLLLLFSCQKSFQQEGKHPKEFTMQQETSSQEGSEVFLLLAQGELVPAGKNIPHGFYVRGEIRDGKFFPLTEVLGTGDLGTAQNGLYGWFELSDRKFYEMQSGRQAQLPFVKGYYSDRNGFLPSARTIFQGP